jgi:hypothetical protein
MSVGPSLNLETSRIYWPLRAPAQGRIQLFEYGPTYKEMVYSIGFGAFSRDPPNKAPIFLLSTALFLFTVNSSLVGWCVWVGGVQIPENTFNIWGRVCNCYICYELCCTFNDIPAYSNHKKHVPACRRRPSMAGSS